MNRPLNDRRAISPIIATLLLILIAIAAGVVVYAYVVGFIGNSTTNAGGATNTLSIDQLNLKGTSTGSLPVTAYVRNLGPSTESFNTGFYIKGSTINDLLGPAITLSVPSGTLTIASSTLTITETSATTVTVATSIASLTCSAVVTLTVSGFGTSNTFACTTSAQTLSVVLTLSGGTVSTSPVYSSTSGPISSAAVSSLVVGTTVSAGVIYVANNAVFDFTLAVQGTQTTNPLTTGTTYTFQITGNDGGSTTLSAKAA